MTAEELKEKDWQLATDASGQTHWRDPLNPVRTYTLELAVKTQKERDANLRLAHPKQ